MIEVRGVSKVYGKKQSAFNALKNVTFTIPDGQTAAIIGKSGSGKSTMMHLLGGLDHVTDGAIIINDQDLTRLRRKKMDHFRAKELGFVFQSFFVEGGATCYQNVSLPLEINKVPKRQRKALIEKALAAVELTDKKNQKARNLSGGQKQRLAIARAIVNSPHLILADEPTGNLDSTTGETIIQLLFSLHRDLGSALIIVTHDQDLAARCDMQISLKDGQIVPNDSLAPRATPVRRVRNL
jgi:putative ABC transport system ATP-binding protein